MRNYLVFPVRLAARIQRDPAFDPWAEMRPKEVIACRRLMDQRARQDEALEKWHTRDIDNSRDKD